jgi:hypothetical protein
VQLNRNVVNGSEPMLRLIGGLPVGTPVAFEAARGWGAAGYSDRPVSNRSSARA